MLTSPEALNLLQSGGTLAALVLALWAILKGHIVTRREFDAEQSRNEKAETKLQKRIDEIDALNAKANDELRAQAATNAKLVELSFLQRQEAEDIRRDPQRRRSTDQ